jgi:hypothetical protein
VGSGLIYLIIVGMWIAYFLPRWIATHEEISGKSVEKFASTMKVVGMTSGNAAPDLEELARRSDHQLATRRIIFISIILATIVTGTLTLLGLLAPVITFIPISGFILYLVHTRQQIHSMQEEVARARSVQKFISQPSRNNYAEIIVRSRRSQVRVESEEWVPLSERVAQHTEQIHGIVILPKGSKQEDGWQPTALPEPSYLTASKAAPVRRIDLTVPGAWSEAQERALLASLAPTADEIFDQDVAEQAAAEIRTARAVNQ